MNPMRCVIVEDSTENIATLRYMLERYTMPLQIVHIAQNLEDAYLALKAPQIDLAFLDVQLQQGTIFEVLEKLKNEQSLGFEMIFVTAHGSFENAVKGIQFACLDFITKPIDEVELHAAIDKASGRTSQGVKDVQIGMLLEQLSNNMQSPSSLGVVLPKGVIEFIQLPEVLYFLADESITEIHFADKRKLTSTKNLGYYIGLLNQHPDFFQVSKGCLVNLQQLKRYNHKEKTLVLKNEEVVIASHRFSKHLRRRLIEMQENVPDQSGLLGMLKQFFGS